MKLFYISLLADPPLQAKMIIHTAYGSQRHLGVYMELGLQPDQIYIHGKKTRKHLGIQECQVCLY